MLQRDPQIAPLLPDKWLLASWCCRGEVRRDQHPRGFNGASLRKSIGSDNNLKSALAAVHWKRNFKHLFL